MVAKQLQQENIALKAKFEENISISIWEKNIDQTTLNHLQPEALERYVAGKSGNSSENFSIPIEIQSELVLLFPLNSFSNNHRTHFHEFCYNPLKYR